MPTSFLTGLSTEVKPCYAGSQQGEDVTRYPLVNSRNYNRKIIRLGNTVTTQKLGIDAPTVAPTGSGGTGSDLYFKYVYVNKKFNDPLADEGVDYSIRSNPSPVSAAVPSSTGAATITATVSADAQVTHIWLYVCDSADGVFTRPSSGYEVANSGTPTWTGPTTYSSTDYTLEEDNNVIDTCRIVQEGNGFFVYSGFVAINKTASVSATIGSATIAGTGFTDGIINLNFQFIGDTSGGPSGNGVHYAKYVSDTELTLVDVDGVTPRNYDGPSNKTNADARIWRDPAVALISKRYNPDFTASPNDLNYLIRGPAAFSGIAKPQTGFALRFHYNNGSSKSVEIVDFTQGLPPRRYQTSSVYAMANPQAWCAAGGRLFYYDYDAGIIEDRESQHIPMTLPVIPNLMRSLGVTSASISEMAYDETRNLLFLSACPSGYSRAYYMIVYNLTTDTWNLWFMLPDVNCMRRVKDQTSNQVVIKMGSSFGSYTSWPSTNFNEGVGSSLVGTIGTNDDSTHLTAVGTPFPTTGDALVDRWVMVWNDGDDPPVYQFARISANTSSRLTLDTFIGPNSTTALSPVPTIGYAYWIGPIQSILGPNWEYNSIPDDDGILYDVSVTSSGLDSAQTSRLAVYRNFETTSTFDRSMVKNLYHDGSQDPDHQSLKLGAVVGIETTGVTGWKITDNNEAPLSIKAIVRRVQAISQIMNKERQ